MTGHRDAFMPLYIGDYLRDTTRLTTVEHGAYMLLLMDEWVNGPPPDDDARLAGITKMNPSQWRKVRATLTGFYEIKGGHWHQDRLERERTKAFGMVEKKRVAGKAGGEAARGKSGRKPNDKTIADEIPKQIADRIAPELQSELQKNTQPQPQPQPQPKEKPAAAEPYDPRAPAEALCEELGIAFTADTSRINWPAELAKWQERGGKIEDLLAAAKREKERGNTAKPLRWYLACSEDFKTKRLADEGSKANESHVQRHRWLENYAVPTDEDGEKKGFGRAGKGGWRWINNTSGNGAWKDIYGVGPPPHDPRTLVTEDELARYPAAKAKRDLLMRAGR